MIIIVVVRKNVAHSLDAKKNNMVRDYVVASTEKTKTVGIVRKHVKYW